MNSSVFSNSSLWRVRSPHPDRRYAALVGNVCGAPSTGRTLRNFCPCGAVCCSACLVTSPTELLVRKGKTPVGQGLLSCRNCQTGPRLLEVTLSEVVAVVVQPGSKEDSFHAQLLAVTACSHMPKKLLQFVQGMSKHHIDPGWQLKCTHTCMRSIQVPTMRHSGLPQCCCGCTSMAAPFGGPT